VARAEGAVLDLRGRPVPGEALGLFRPEGIGILERAGVHLFVLIRVDIGAFLPLRRNVVNFLGHILLQAPRRKSTVRNHSLLFGPSPRGRVAPIMRRWHDERQVWQYPTSVAGIRSHAAKWQPGVPPTREQGDE